ncbi:hypothetical protein GTP46_05520 [Duganella sp. FT135W]|uniref:Uncharacterized protein n=1 Tax=Duganella flavida TaxID=2692175 RepID=A0A6L8K889_9BURK|nr:hypothetical protein [Duganella flavida]MYM22102.1 hypothetical protein [Duganella flavida]
MKEAQRVEDKVEPFGGVEIRAILATCKPEDRNMLLFAFVAGMRPSEYIALKWSSVDGINTRYSLSGQMWIERVETKTEAGRRHIICGTELFKLYWARVNTPGLETEPFSAIRTRMRLGLMPYLCFDIPFSWTEWLVYRETNGPS